RRVLFRSLFYSTSGVSRHFCTDGSENDDREALMLRISVNDKCISEKILVADNMLSRIIGLMFRASPPQEAEGLLLDPCNSIHTCFMRYPIDVAFLNSQNKVIKIIRNLK